MIRRIGTIGHWSTSPGFGLGLAVALMAGIEHEKRRPRPPPTPKQIAEADKRSERQRWNDEVEARKIAKKARSP